MFARLFGLRGSFNVSKPEGSGGRSFPRPGYRPTLELLEGRELLAVFIVNSATDSLAGGANPAPTGATSGILRQMIANSNATAGPNTIQFQIAASGVQPISLLADLPAITVTTTLDGTTEGGFSGMPLVVLDGTAAGNANGLTLKAAGCTVKALDIVNFKSITPGFGNGIVIDHAGAGSSVQNCFLGINAAGTAAAANANNGVLINGSGGNIIGGTTSTAFNVISGNGASGIEIIDDGTNPANGNMVEGNFIGLNAAGNSAVGNQLAGVFITSTSIGADDNIIGGTTLPAGNVISGNSASGVTIDGPAAAANVVEGNLIGTNGTNSAAIGNVNEGVLIQDSSGNTVGGSTPSAGNIVCGTQAGNGLPGIGVYILSDSASRPASDNVVNDNLIGLTTTSGAPLPNNGAGVVVDTTGTGVAMGNVIGGGDSVGGVISGNVISGNTGRGVVFSGAGTTGNQVSANIIGTNVAKAATNLGNTLEGVYVTNGASNNTIGGTPGSSTDGPNTIADNGTNGILIGANATAPLFPPAADTPAGGGNATLVNSIFGNTDAGIATNSGQAAPVITEITFTYTTGPSSTIIGTLTSTANTTFTLNFYTNPNGALDQGKTFLGTSSVTTNNSGVASISQSFPMAFAAGSSVTVTANSPANNTSPYGGLVVPNSDGVQGLAAYRPSNGSWSLDSNGEFGFQTGGTEGQAPLSDRVLASFSPTQGTAPGSPTVYPVSGDWAGIGTSEIGDFENGTWHLDLNNNGILDSGEAFQFGTTGDQPVPGNWLSPNQISLAVFRPNFAQGFGTFIISDANWLAEAQAGQQIGIATSFIFGAATDTVVVGDWNGAGLTEVGVYRPATAFGAPSAYVFTLDIANHRTFDSSNKVFIFGAVGDGVVIGDWNGSGTSKVGVYRPATSFNAPNTAVFSLDFSGQFQFITGQSEVFLYGLPTDKYVTGTWAYTTSTAAASPAGALADPTALGAFFANS